MAPLLVSSRTVKKSGARASLASGGGLWAAWHEHNNHAHAMKATSRGRGFIAFFVGSPSSATMGVSWLEAPVHVAIIGHRFVDKRVKIGVVVLQGLARVDRVGAGAEIAVPRRVFEWRSVLPGGAEIGQH